MLFRSIMVAGFVDIKEFVFTVQWDATKLQFTSADNSTLSALSTTNIDISAAASGKIHFTWVGAPLTLVDGFKMFTMHFTPLVYSPTPTRINFTSDPPAYTTIFKNASDQSLSVSSSYGEVKTVICTQIIPSLRCNTATLLCAKDLPMCGRLPDSNTQDNPGINISCGNIQNNVWFAFDAATDSIKIKIKISSCVGLGDGVQASILETNDCVNFMRVECNPGINRSVREGFINVLGTGRLTIGKRYYLMIDGVTGDVCDFQIDIIEGAIGSATVAAPTVMGASTTCPNQSNLTFSIPTQPNALGYAWKIAGGNATILSGSNTPSVNVNWGTVSDSVCVRVVGRCDSSLWSCKAVAVSTTAVKDVTITKCPSATYTFNNQALTNPGSYTATFRSFAGCDSVINLTLLNYSAATRSIDSTVCIGSTVQIGTKSHSTEGVFRDTLVGASFRGCDSIVILTLSVIQSGISLIKDGDLSCTMQTVKLTANYNKSPATAVETFEWKNPNWGSH